MNRPCGWVCVMGDPKGDKLYVNISASQARKRLKGFGHGVRKVQSAGKTQAVIIHTATGQHLEELELKFADVGTSDNGYGLGEPIESLRNLGPTSAAWLREISVHTKADLERLGPAFAYRLVKQWQPSTSLNLLWAMAGALADKDWLDISDEEKEKLRQEID
jgi:DNA transformation protein